MNDTHLISPTKSNKYSMLSYIYLSTNKSLPNSDNILLNSTPLIAHLNPLQNITLNTSIFLNPPRENCLIYNYVCLKIDPSLPKTFKIPINKSSSYCVNLNNTLNCQGLKIENMTIKVIIDGDRELTKTLFRISWDRGTDVNYTISFGDGNFLSYNWLNSSQKYFNEYQKDITYIYKSFDVFTVEVFAENNLNQETVSVKKVVNPVLSKNIGLELLYLPDKPPVQATFIFYWYPRNFKNPKSLYMNCNITIEKNIIEMNRVYMNSSIPKFYYQSVITENIDSVGAEIVCRNSFSNISKTCKIILQQNVNGLEISYGNFYLQSLLSVALMISLKNGSDVVYDVSFGDGTQKNYVDPDIYANIKPIYLNHTFYTNGTFQTHVVAKNSYFNDSKTIQVYVQHVIDSIDYDIQYDAPSSLNFKLLQTSSPLKPTNVSCQFKIANESNYMETSVDLIEGFSFHHSLHPKYNFRPMKNVSIVINCFNQISERRIEKFVITEEKITGLLIKSNKYAVGVNNSLKIFVSVETGTFVTFAIDYGDGFSENVSITEPKGNITFFYNYSEIGNFTPSVKAINSVNFFNATLIKPIVAQVPIKNVTISGPSVVDLQAQPVKFLIQVNLNGPAATDIFCAFKTPKSLKPSDFTFQPDLSRSKSVEQTFSFNRSDVGLIFDVLVICKNQLSSFSSSRKISVYEPVTGLALVSPKKGKPFPEIFNFSLKVLTGSSVTFRIEIDNQVIIEENHPDLFATQRYLNYSYKFPSIGNFSLKLSAFNFISKQVVEDELYSQYEILQIRSVADKIIKWPPGIIQYNLTSHSNQKTLHHVHCKFNFSNGIIKSLYIPQWGKMTLYSITYKFPRSAVGILNATVKCGNMISERTDSTQTEIILDAVDVESIRDNGTVVLTNKTVIITKLKRMGTNGCLIYDLGDENETKIAFGVNNYCQKLASSDLIPFTLISFDTDFIIFNHTYDKIAYYNVSVKAFNHLAYQNIWFITQVAPYYCTSPKANISADYLNRDKIIKGIKSEPYYIPSSYEINCTMSFQALHNWKIFDLSNNNLIFVLTNNKFILPPRVLDYGKYRVEYFIYMMLYKQYNNTYEAFFEIIPSPLNFNISTGNILSSKYDEDIIIDARSLSADPDNEPSDKFRNVIFKWYCYQEGENLTETEIYSGPKLNDIPTKNQFFERGGCFGHGPGLVKTSYDGYWNFSSFFMLPNRTYNIKARMISTIANRKVEQSVELFILPPSAPHLKLKSVLIFTFTLPFSIQIFTILDALKTVEKRKHF